MCFFESLGAPSNVGKLITHAFSRVCVKGADTLAKEKKIEIEQHVVRLEQ
jgi:hypothetical protein